MSTISSRELIGFCRRVGPSIRAGIASTRIWEDECQRGSRPYREAMSKVLEHVSRGDSVTSGLQASGYFPQVTLAMVEIGEYTGKLDEALLRIAEQQEHQRKLVWQFFLGIAWPAFQLFVGIFLVGGVIYALGVIGAMYNSEPIDVTGLGLSGARGAAIYFLTIGLVLAVLTTLVVVIAKGLLGPKVVEVAMRTPLIGTALRHTAMSRLTWSLGMALDAGIDARHSAELAIMATQNPHYLSRTPMVLDSIRQNRTFYESFRDAQGFPQDFLDQIETAEMSGTLSEALVRMAAEYTEKAKTALQMLAMALTVVVWVMFAGILIALIFRLFSIYLGSIYNALEQIDGPKRR